VAVDVFLPKDTAPEPPKAELAALDNEQLPELEELAEIDPPFVEAEPLQLLAFAMWFGIVGIKSINVTTIKAPVIKANFCIFQGI
jgi:hypothetical protein